MLNTEEDILNTVVRTVLMDEELIAQVKKERALNNNQLSEIEKGVIRRTIDQKYIKGDTEIAFHSQNTLAVAGYPTTITEVLEYCREYQPDFNTNLTKIAEYAHQSKKFIKEWNAERLQEYYARIMTPEEALKVVTRERSISPGLSGFEKTCIDRFLNNNFRYPPEEEHIIFAICDEFKNSGFPATREEIMTYIHEHRGNKNASNAIVWFVMGFILFGIFMFLAI